ncbi:MAG: hypothetical protein ACJAZO_002157 [Myxococcota bacterium]|jgi:hypothetical protein
MFSWQFWLASVTDGIPRLAAEQKADQSVAVVKVVFVGA